MVYDYSKLVGKIKEKFGTQEKFADALDLGRVSLSLSLNSKREFSQKEINSAIELLNLEKTDIPEYFLKKKFRKLSK